MLLSGDSCGGSLQISTRPIVIVDLLLQVDLLLCLPLSGPLSLRFHAYADCGTSYFQPIIMLLAVAGGKGADFLVVDINYFPGYEKLPNHAALMVEFLQSLLIPSKDQGTQVQRHLSSCLDSPGSDSE